MQILIVNLPDLSCHSRTLEDPLLGGRLLSSLLVSEFSPPDCDALGESNALVFACGPLAGLRVSTGGRLSVGAKSPLTRGIKEANAGGMASDSLAELGFRALVVRGALPAGTSGVLVLDEEGCRLESGERYWGVPNEAAAMSLRDHFGADYVVISIGPAGEQQLKAAGIAVTDANDMPFRLAARGGLGAVMGSKGLKAILIKRAGRQGATRTSGARPAITGFTKHVATSPRTEVLRQFGTASTVHPLQTLGGLPVRNFSAGRMTDAEPISGERMYEIIQTRGGTGTPTEACMNGCVIQCSNIYPAPDGTLAAAPVEFETIGLCGSNLDIASLDDIARINRICNDLGLDTIEIGAALGVMMEAVESGQVPEEYAQFNLPSFGDGARAAELVEEIRMGTALGCLLGSGVVAVGEALGVSRIPAVKGQAMSAYDPRVVKGTGVTYATSPQGADHSAGLTFFAPVDHLDPKIAVKVSRSAQIQRAAYDALGLCVFNLSATAMQPQLVLDMLRSVFECDIPPDWLDQVGLRTIQVEREYNQKAGFTDEDDRLPQYFREEVLPPLNTVFDVSNDDLDSIWKPG
jgi:aldehyde:ferredoxin oxidoreductase